MNLETHYNNLYKTPIERIKNDDYQIDELIYSLDDKRFGITLLIRPPLEVKQEIQKFLQQLQAIEPDQYYYRNSDIHITVMSIISCYQDFDLKQINVADYIDIIQKSISDCSSFDIEFKGITASPSCIMIQGFMKDDVLNTIRNNLRTHFKNSNLEQSLDKRYSIQTAHTTVLRFSAPLKNTSAFLTKLKAYKNYNFGSFKVDTLELVYNDWYQKKEKVKNLFTFKL